MGFDINVYVSGKLAMIEHRKSSMNGARLYLPALNTRSLEYKCLGYYIFAFMKYE